MTGKAGSCSVLQSQSSCVQADERLNPSIFALSRSLLSFQKIDSNYRSGSRATFF